MLLFCSFTGDTETVELNKNLQEDGARDGGVTYVVTKLPPSHPIHTSTGNLKVASSNLQLSGSGTHLERV